MHDNYNCPECGIAVPVDAPGGHCPGCLLRLSLSVADGGIAFALNELRAEELESSKNGAESPRTRHLSDYELLEEIGRGGMGIVYKARQISLNRLVALKLVRAGELADERELGRFRAEAEAAAQVDHPNIVPIYEVGDHEGHHYFSMKWIEGGSLAQRIKSRAAAGRYELRAAALTVSKIARGVHYAHQRGILHRDLKPQNILMDARNEPHITDFGLAKRIESDSAMTLSGMIIGTPNYIAPEQAAGVRLLTTAADVYGLGGILYELLTGVPPFTGRTILETLLKVREQEPKPPQALNPSVDSDLSTVCLKCLRKEPSARYSSAEALAEDLERWLDHKPIQARPVSTGERMLKWIQRKPALAAAAFLVLLTFVAGVTGVTWQWRQTEAARKEAVAKLWNSYLDQARAVRHSGVIGQRIESLTALQAAARIRSSPELRDEAIAALALNDLGTTRSWRPHAFPMAYSDWAAASSLARIAIRDHAKEAIRVWRPDTGEETELSFNRRNGRELRFSPDGRWLAAHYYSGELVLWDCDNGESRLLGKVGLLSEHEPMDFSHDNQILGVAAADFRIRLFDVVSGAELAPLVFSNGNWTPTLKFNPVKASMVVGVGDSIQVWDYETRKLVFNELLPHRMYTVAWHPDGQRIAFAGWRDSTVQLWDVEGAVRRVLHGVSGAPNHLSFHPRGDMLACRGTDGVTRLWDLATEQAVLKTETGLAMDFSGDGKRLIFDRETEGVGIWQVELSRIYRTFRAAGSLAQPLNHIAFSPEGRLLVWSGVDGLCWLDQVTGRVNAQRTEDIRSFAFHPSGQSLLVSESGRLERLALRWTTNQAEPQLQFVFSERRREKPGDSGRFIRWVALSGDGGTAAVGANTWSSVIPADSAAEGTQVFSPTNSINLISMAFSKDGRWLAFGEEEENCVIYDAAARKIEQMLEEPSAVATFDPTGRWLLTGTVREYKLWELGTWKCLRRWARKSALIRSGAAAISPDATLLAVAHSPDLVRLLNPETGTVLATLTPPSPLLIRGLAFSPDGSQLAIASDNGIAQLWEIADLRLELQKLGLDWKGQPDVPTSTGILPR